MQQRSGSAPCRLYLVRGEPSQEAPRITSALGLVAAKLGVALVPASMRRVRMDGVAYRALQPAECPTVPLRPAMRREGGSTALRNFVDLAAGDRSWRW